MKESKMKVFRAYLLITLGALIYCLAWTIFILPHHMVSGGVSGISAIMQYCTGIRMSYTFAVINTILLLVSLKVLGKGFGVRTVYAVALLSLLLRVFPEVIPEDFIASVSIANGKLLCAIIGGGLTGVGVSMMVANGGSSGGTDIIALVVNKFYDISPGHVILFLDVFIIASSLIIPSESGWGARVATIIYGFVIVGIFSTTLDRVLQSNRQCVQLFVFSKKYDVIADRIMREENRGVSVITAEGWYSKSDVRVLLAIMRKTQLDGVMAIIKEEDPSAFTSVGTVMGVYGEGFDKMKNNKSLQNVVKHR